MKKSVFSGKDELEVSFTESPILEVFGVLVFFVFLGGGLTSDELQAKKELHDFRIKSCFFSSGNILVLSLV